MSTLDFQGQSGDLQSPPVAPSDGTGDGADKRIEERRSGKVKWLDGDQRGHTSLYLVFFSFVLYKAWQIAFAYPPTVQVVVPGIGSMDTKTWSALINGLGGWLSLSAIVSLAQPGRFVRNLLRPLYAIDDEYIRKVFRNPISLVLSFAIFLVTLSIICCNVAIQISSGYEVLVSLPSGHGSAKLAKGDKIEDDIRLATGETARLLLRGWQAREVVLIRDRYNLVTLEALEVRRSFMSFGFRPLSLTVGGRPVKACLDGMTSLDKVSLFSLHNRGSLSFSNRAVLIAILADGGKELYSGRLLVGEPDDGAEDPPDTHPSVTLFFKDLWTARDLFASWTVNHQRHIDGAGLILHHPTQNYNNRVLFAEGTIAWDDGKRRAETKEAIFLLSRKTDLPPTGTTLDTAMASFQADPAYQVVGLKRPGPRTKTVP